MDHTIMPHPPNHMVQGIQLAELALTCDHMVTYHGVMNDDDRVFKALSDPTRRYLLDRLFVRDGRTLTELESELDMTRFGVMKHLRILEDAGLVVTRRSGREKLHFLNPVPIRLVHDRWVSKYAEPWAAALSGLKRTLEGEFMEKVFEIYIKTSPERLWEAITDNTMRQQYWFGLGVKTDWTPGSHYEGIHPFAPGAIHEGENLEVDPPRRLVQTFRGLWSEDVKAEGTSRVTWEISPVGDSCRLLVTHDQLREGANNQLYGGWPMILSGLKTLLETGESLTTPGSLLYSASPTPAS
ncbi:MAG: SRPBCC domain-containing protein [Pseudarthrobacter sp.]